MRTGQKVKQLWGAEARQKIGARSLAGLAALAVLVASSGPALALDKVKFATNWLADPEAGGFYQALVDGTYAKYGLDVTIIPGGPQTNGALLLLFGKVHFFMGGDMIGDFLAELAKLPLVAVAAEFQKIAADLHVASGRRARQMARPAASAKTAYVGAGAIIHVLRLDEARLRIQVREHPPVQLQFRSLHHEQGLRSSRAILRRAI